jgi:hypothetical protein
MSLSSFATDLFKPSLKEEAFFRAIETRDEKYVAKILTYYPDVANRLSPDGRSPLNIAVDRHNPEICKLLLDAGANLEFMDPKMKMQPLNRSLHTGYADIAELLIDRGADVNARDGNGNGSGNNAGQTPLYMAVSECPVAILKKLVAKGAQINVYCDDNTPLTLAAMANNQHDNADNIKYLLSAGADIGMGKPSNRVTADQLAYQGNMSDYLKQKKKEYDDSEVVREAAHRKMQEIREKEAAALREKQAIVDEIASTTEGTPHEVRVGPALRFKRPTANS